MNECERRKCPFWDGMACQDPINFETTAGDPVCRFHPDAIHEDDRETGRLWNE